MNAEYLHEIGSAMDGNLSNLLFDMRQLNNRIDGLHLIIQKRGNHNDVGRQELLKWIDAVFTDNDYERALTARVEGTCDWIFDRTVYKECVTSDSQSEIAKVLCIHSSAGFGKTILTSYITSCLRLHTQIAYFFCYFGDEKKRQPQQIVRSWVAQLVANSDDASEIAREVLQESKSSRLTDSVVWLLLKRIIRVLDNVVLIADGFDECAREESNVRIHAISDNQGQFLDNLEDSIQRTSARVLLNSRETSVIRNRYGRNMETPHDRVLSWLEYDNGREDTEIDIYIYANKVVEETLYRKTREFQEELALRLARKADGMFLYIRRLQPRLKSKASLKCERLRAVIEEITNNLDEAYDRGLKLICRLDDYERDRALAIIRWVLYAYRPLTVRGLSEALLISIANDQDLDMEESFPKDDLPEIWDDYYIHEQIISLRGSIVTLRVDDHDQPIEDHTVHFIHFSIQEYLLHSDSPQVAQLALCQADAAHNHDILGQICLKYFCLDDFEQK